MSRPRVQQLIRRSGDRLADSAPRRAVLAFVPAGVARLFDPAAAAGLEATFELRVDGHAFAVQITDQRCVVTPGPATDPGAAVTVGGDDLIRLASGAAAWPALLSSGRMELAGDPFLALRFPNLFGLRASSSPPRTPRSTRSRRS
jgi:SCP-2 sterol transfer family protein